MTGGDLLLAIPVWVINGFLSVLYWVIANFADTVSVFVAVLIAFGIDPYIQNRATARPRRYDRGAVQTASPTAQYFTLGTAAAWVFVSQLSEFPIPMIGAVMWVVGFFGILASSEQRFNQLWWAKIGLLAYAAIVLLLRFFLGTLNQVNAADWAAVVGSSADAQLVINQTRGNVATLGLFFLWVIFPLGYMAMLWNRFLRNPKPLYATFVEAGDVIKRLRSR